LPIANISGVSVQSARKDDGFTCTTSNAQKASYFARIATAEYKAKETVINSGEVLYRID